MSKRSTVAVLVVASFLIGLAMGWRFRGSRSERDAGTVAVVRAVEVAGLCANALGAAEGGRAANLQRLLEMRMANAIDEGAERVDSASSPSLALPNLIEGLSRARQYAAARGMPETVRKCDRLLEFLAKSNARA